MDPTAALPLVMPGRFGVLCRPSSDYEGPFDEGWYCVTVIPSIAVLREWAELIVEHWPIVRWAFWSPFRSVVVRYVDLDEYPLVFGEEYFHSGGELGSYDLMAHRQFLTMAQLFQDFMPYELTCLSLYWTLHNGGPLVLDTRWPSLADHQAIQRWVVHEFDRQMQLAFVRSNYDRRYALLHCAEERAAQDQEYKENLRRRKYTIEGYEHFRFSLIIMKKLPQLQRDAIDGICSFLLGRPIASLHLVG